jgi:hypothetical protein
MLYLLRPRILEAYLFHSKCYQCRLSLNQMSNHCKRSSEQLMSYHFSFCSATHNGVVRRLLTESVYQSIDYSYPNVAHSSIDATTQLRLFEDLLRPMSLSTKYLLQPNVSFDQTFPSTKDLQLQSHSNGSASGSFDRRSPITITF